MIAVARPLFPNIDCQWSGDRQHAGHHPGALDPGGDASEASQVHGPRVPKAPTDRRHSGREVLASEPRLDVLINNTGIGMGSDGRRRQESADGYELRFALHPASLMDTKLVFEAFGATMGRVRDGMEATVRLALTGA
jgi:hypothetical protein